MKLPSVTAANMSIKAFKEFMVGFLFENHETSELYGSYVPAQGN